MYGWRIWKSDTSPTGEVKKPNRVENKGTGMFLSSGNILQNILLVIKRQSVTRVPMGDRGDGQGRGMEGFSY